MKICFLCNEYPPCPRVGGIGTFTHTIAHGLADVGHEITVLGYGEHYGEWKDNGIRVVVLAQSTMRGVAWFVNRWNLYLWLKHEACAGRIDIVEAPDYQGMLPFPFSVCPVIIRLHTSFIPVSKLQRILERKTLKIHRNWIGVSKWIVTETQRKYNLMPENGVVIYNPVPDVDVNIMQLDESLCNFVIYVGTVRDGKGAYTLAEAANMFLAAHQDLHLIYIGGLTVENGKRSDETIRRILRNEIMERVHFLGSVEHDAVLAYMRKARICVLPSKLEAFSMVPLEAMSCGVPIVYSASHSGPEAIDDGVTGLLADPYSSSDIAEKVEQILNDPSLGARLAENAKEVVKKRFSIQQCVRKTLKFYEQCSLHITRKD